MLLLLLIGATVAEEEEAPFVEIGDISGGFRVSTEGRLRRGRETVLRTPGEGRLRRGQEVVFRQSNEGRLRR